MDLLVSLRLVLTIIGATVALAALLAPHPGHADWMWLGGGETVFDGEYAQMTALFPFSGSLGSGFVHRYSVSYIGYTYPVGEDTVEAEGWSATAALGYQIPVTNGWLGFAAGAAYRNTEFTPPQPDNPQDGSQVVAQLDVDAGRIQDNRWLYATSISYTPRFRAYWGRARVLHRTGDGSFLGPEFVAHGDRDYDAQQLGLALQLNRVMGPLDLVLKAGAKRIRDGDSGAYAGIEFLRHFQ